MSTHTSVINARALDEREAARLLGYSKHALRVWRRVGTGPAYIHAGRTIRYLESDLLAWQTAHRVEPRALTPAGAR